MGKIASYRKPVLLYAVIIACRMSQPATAQKAICPGAFLSIFSQPVDMAATSDGNHDYRAATVVSAAYRSLTGPIEFKFFVLPLRSNMKRYFALGTNAASLECRKINHQKITTMQP